jgi:methyl-accepting chemotaxis protein
MTAVNPNNPLSSEQVQLFSSPASVNSLEHSRRRFVTNISLFMASTYIFGLVFIVVLSVLTNTWYNLVTIPVLLVGMGVHLFTWYLGKKNRVDFAAWLLVIVALVSDLLLFLLFSTNLVVWFVSLIAVLLALILLGPRVAFGCLLVKIACGFFASFSGQFIAIDKVSSAQSKVGLEIMIPLVFIDAIIFALATYLATHLNVLNTQLQQQATQLKGALTDIEQKRAVGENVSRKIFSLTAGLNAISSQQVVGSQEQVSAITEITASLRTLTLSAQEIASRTEQLSKQTAQIKAISQRVKSSASKVVEDSTQGVMAMDDATNSNQQFSAFYNDLHEILMELGQRQDQIKTIVSTTQTISNQTHLLALNAAIEAAGAGEYGERFGVVAREVKALAEHSRQAGEEISNNLNQIEQQIHLAINAAQKGYGAMQLVLEASGQSGVILRQLVAGIYQNAEQAELIEQAVSLANDQAKQISFGTDQQYSASNQALENLEGVTNIASQSLQGSAEVTKNTNALEELSQQLFLTLST